MTGVDAEAYRLMRAGKLREALLIAERAVEGARICLPDHSLLASILLQLGRDRDALRVADRAAGLEPGDAEAYDALAHVNFTLERHEQANGLYRRAAELAPDIPRYWYNLACSERSFGRLSEAEQACDRCIALDPAQHSTYVLRSELRVQTRHANHIEELRAQLARPDQGAAANAMLAYTLAKELDDVRRFDEAFHWFAVGARTRRSQITYDVAEDERTMRRLAEVFPRGRAGGPQSDAGSRCIFIVGLPRSGTTLVERVLTGLGGVRSNGETENFLRALAGAAPVGNGDMFERAAAADPRRVAADYVRFARLGLSADRVIEKLPTNYLYAGAIVRALPEAKILLVRRTPLDSCFAMFRTLFGEAFPFTYDFDELARYYAAYEQLMNHWRSVLGDRLLDIVYEQLVREPHVVGAAAARHCGLTWDDRALDIQRNASVSLTASAAQVRRPIYGTSSGRWREYRGHLAPLIAALRRRGVSLPDDA